MKAYLKFLSLLIVVSISSCWNDYDIEVLPNHNDFVSRPGEVATLDLSQIKVDPKYDEMVIYSADKIFNTLMKKINKADINAFIEAEKLNATYFSSALDIDLYIDSTGRPVKILFKQNVDEHIQKEIAESFSKMKYLPAEDKGVKVKSTLSIKLGAGIYDYKEIKMPVWSYQELPPQKETIEKFAKQIDKNSYLQLTTTMPAPIGGVEAIMKNIYYPEEAKRNNIEGKVYIQAYINESGTVDGVNVIKGIGSGCDEAAMEAVLASKFIPGKNDKGEPVKVIVAIPFVFKLSQSN